MLSQAVKSRSIASLTCLQARQIVQEMFPDILKFTSLPRRWRVLHAMNFRGSDDLTEFPRHILRFNEAEDIFVSNASWADKKASVKIAQLELEQKCNYGEF